MKLNLLLIMTLSALLFSCNNENTNQAEAEQKTVPTFQNKGHEYVYEMVQKIGDYSKLLEKKDVIYTYTYETPDGKKNVSTEKYIFDQELSYASYSQHAKTFPDLEGTIEQGYDGNEFWLKHNDTIVQDSARLKQVAFSRLTNFYWFAMFQKLLDPGIIYNHVGLTTIDDIWYNVVKVSFESDDDKPTDIYQLYINQETNLIDQFLFTVADFGIIETPKLMLVEYEKIDGMLLPTKRKYKTSTWNATINDEPWITANWSNIKFNNGLKQADFEK